MRIQISKYLVQNPIYCEPCDSHRNPSSPAEIVDNDLLAFQQVQRLLHGTMFGFRRISHDVNPMYTLKIWLSSFARFSLVHE